MSSAVHPFSVAPRAVSPSQSWNGVATPTNAPFVLTGGLDLVCSGGKGLAMTTKMIAGLIGPTLVAIAVAVLINFGSRGLPLWVCTMSGQAAGQCS
jgi:hypothetical protein